jgi:Protein of unknown function (DUF4427)
MIRHLPEHTFFSARPLIGLPQTVQPRAATGAPRTGSGEADEGEVTGGPAEGVRNGSIPHVHLGTGGIKGAEVGRKGWRPRRVETRGGSLSLHDGGDFAELERLHESLLGRNIPESSRQRLLSATIKPPDLGVVSGGIALRGHSKGGVPFLLRVAHRASMARTDPSGHRGVTGHPLPLLPPPPNMRRVNAPWARRSSSGRVLPYPMHENLRRYDLSDWLIHFTRPLNIEHNDTPPELSDWESFGEAVSESVISPFFLLRRILRKRQLLSTWSVRKGRRTVYGPRPAVCFTEMPLAAFLQASAARSARRENMSSYAVMLRKTQAFQLGALPVIYGLSDPTARAQDQSDGARLFPANVLPLVEQYRYLAFNPGGSPDWTHEREWRWPNSQHKPFLSFNIPDEDSAEYVEWNAWNEARQHDRFDGDGLCLDSGAFENVGFLVKNDRQAKLLTHDILRLVDAETVPTSLVTFILRLGALPVPQKLLDPVDVEKAIDAATVPLAPFFNMDAAEAKKIRAQFDKIARAVGDDPRRDAGEFGGCWLWLMDNTHPLTRALISAPEEERRVEVSRLGRYLVWLPELGDDRGLRLRQDLTKEIASRVQAAFGARATYYSVLNSDDPDEVPSYTDDWDDIYMNEAHNKDDF